jgi:hypothetical protein
MDCEQVRELLDAYALGATEPGDAKAVEEHVADCVRCWDELSTGQRTAALIALTVPIEQAPARLEQRIIAQAQRERSPKLERAPFWQRLRTWPAAAGALSAASLAALSVSAFLGFQVQDLHNQNSDLQAQLSSTTTTLQQQLADTNNQLADQRSISTILSDDTRKQIDMSPPGGNGIAEAYYTWSPDSRKGFMVCDNLPSLKPGEVYQVWVVTDSSQSVPMATFTSTDGTCQATMDFAAVSLTGRPTGIGVTAEDAPGGATQPTGPWLLYAHL